MNVELRNKTAEYFLEVVGGGMTWSCTAKLGTGG